MQSVDASGDVNDVMTPFGVLNRSTTEAPARAAVHVLPCTPRTRARSDQFNPEAEHAIAHTSPRSRRAPNKPDAESDVATLFEKVVPHAGPSAEARVAEHGSPPPSPSKVHPFLPHTGSSDGSYDEHGREVTPQGTWIAQVH